MSVRYQMSIASLGGDLRSEREKMVQSVTALGHFPLDLTATGVLDKESLDAVERHMGRSDYLILIIERGEPDATADLERVERALAYALEHGVPILGIGTGETGGGSHDAATAELPIIETLVERIRSGSRTMFLTGEEVAESAVWILVKMIDAHPRPGWVPTTELPSGDVATELVRLMKDNTDLRHQLELTNPERPIGGLSEDQEISLSLNENKILIPIWERANSTWEKPAELTLYDFFVRMSPEMVIEISVSDAAEFIPTGVVEMDPIEHVRWVVPHRSVNLWFTDLMALGLVTPSERKHAAKDHGHYWTLTGAGRKFFAQVRRSVLETGGHRNVGFTSEFPIFTQDRPIP